MIWGVTRHPCSSSFLSASALDKEKSEIKPLAASLDDARAAGDGLQRPLHETLQRTEASHSTLRQKQDHAARLRQVASETGIGMKEVTLDKRLACMRIDNACNGACVGIAVRL